MIGTDNLWELYKQNKQERNVEIARIAKNLPSWLTDDDTNKAIKLAIKLDRGFRDFLKIYFSSDWEGRFGNGYQ